MATMDKVWAFRQAEIIMERAKAEAIAAGFKETSDGSISSSPNSMGVTFTLYFEPDPKP